jgi:hypothetical protein
VTSAAAGLAASAIETAATTRKHIRIEPPSRVRGLTPILMTASILS